MPKFLQAQLPVAISYNLSVAQNSLDSAIQAMENGEIDKANSECQDVTHAITIAVRELTEFAKRARVKL